MIRPLTVALALTIAPALATGAEPVRLATFNIHHGEGPDGVLDLGRVADAVRGADVVALQEVDVRFRERSRFEDQADLLARKLGGEVAFAGNLVEGEGRYGVALVSKFPILARTNHPLPRAPGREKAEPRGLLETTLDIRGARVRVFVTHLAHDSAADRVLQVEEIRRVVAAGTGPAVLMGDLNFRPEDGLYARLLAPAEGKSAPPFVDAWPKAGEGPGPTIDLGGKTPGRIDYILATPDLAPGFEHARVNTETKASDHQPVAVDLRLNPSP